MATEEIEQLLEQLRNKKVESYDDLLDVYTRINTLMEQQDKNLNKELLSILILSFRNFNTTVPDTNGLPQSLVSLAVSNDHLNVLEILIKASLIPTDSEKLLEGIIADQERDPELAIKLVSLFVKYGHINTNKVNNDHYIPTMLAIKYGKPEK